MISTALPHIPNQMNNRTLLKSYLILFITKFKDVVTRSDENEQNRLEVNTKLFRPLLDQPRKTKTHQ